MRSAFLAVAGADGKAPLSAKWCDAGGSDYPSCAPDDPNTPAPIQMASPSCQPKATCEFSYKVTASSCVASYRQLFWRVVVHVANAAGTYMALSGPRAAASAEEVYSISTQQAWGAVRQGFKGSFLWESYGSFPPGSLQKTISTVTVASGQASQPIYLAFSSQGANPWNYATVLACVGAQQPADDKGQPQDGGKLGHLAIPNDPVPDAAFHVAGPAPATTTGCPAPPTSSPPGSATWIRSRRTGPRSSSSRSRVLRRTAYLFSALNPVQVGRAERLTQGCGGDRQGWPGGWSVAGARCG